MRFLSLLWVLLCVKLAVLKHLSLNPYGPAMCSQLCNSVGDCAAAYYDAHHSVCHLTDVVMEEETTINTGIKLLTTNQVCVRNNVSKAFEQSGYWQCQCIFVSV